MNWGRAILVGVIGLVLICGAMFMTGMFMHGDPIEVPN